MPAASVGVGAELGSAVTGPDGSYSIDIGDYTGNVLVQVTGGTYMDEATGTTRVNTTLRAAVTAVNGSVSVNPTPWTEVAVQLFSPLATGNISAANIAVSTIIGGLDIISTTPTDLTGGASGSQAENDYGLALAAISQMAEDNGTTVDAVIAQLAAELRFNLSLNGSGTQLSTAISNFINSANNHSGLTLASTGLDESVVLFTGNPVTYATSIAGSWLISYVTAGGVTTPGEEPSHLNPWVLTFYNDGTYINHSKAAGFGCTGGVEQGRYVFNPIADTLVMTPTNDLNGRCGLSDPGGLPLSATVSGDTFVVSSPTAGWETTFSRVDGGSGSIVGGWESNFFSVIAVAAKPFVGSPSPEALTFYDNGFYIHYQNDDGTAGCVTGVEYGTYDFNATIDTLVVTPIDDFNGTCGFSDAGGIPLTPVAVTGDRLSIFFFPDSTTFDFSRVTGRLLLQAGDAN